MGSRTEDDLLVIDVQLPSLSSGQDWSGGRVGHTVVCVDILWGTCPYSCGTGQAPRPTTGTRTDGSPLHTTPLGPVPGTPRRDL